METAELISQYRTMRQSFYEWRDSTEFVYKLMLAFIFTCLTGVGAYMRVYTPISPVPFTAQVFFVLLSGAMLGSLWGGMSQVMYVILGVVGVPWFAGGASGAEYMMGATGGYLVGFILAALLIGYIVDTYGQSRTLLGMMPVMMLGVAVIYVTGATWLGFYLGVDVWKAVALGITPFILLDVVKAMLAGGVGRLVTIGRPSRPFQSENRPV
jgi:biotin transport system substrate-specific component